MRLTPGSHSRRRREGAAAVEAAIVLPLTFLLLLGILIGSAAIFAYQEVASLAREGARWAKVHGDRYVSSTGSLPVTPEDVYNNAIKPRMVTLQPEQLTYSVSWPEGRRIGKPVIVTVHYDWDLGYVFGDLEFESTSVMDISW